MRPSYAAERAASYVLPAGTLAAFAPGLDWDAIATLDARHGLAWWRCAIADAEERGLLTWEREAQRWTLTDDGRAAVRSVS